MRTLAGGLLVLGGLVVAGSLLWVTWLYAPPPIFWFMMGVILVAAGAAIALNEDLP